MITVKYADKPITMDNLHLVFFDQSCIAQIARLMVADHVECFVDMIDDMVDECPQTFAETQKYLDGAKTSLVECYLPYLLPAFKEALVAAVEKVQLELKAIKLNKEGLRDVEIEIS